MRKTIALLSVLLCLGLTVLRTEAAECSHSFERKEEPATCTDPGYRYEECGLCGAQRNFENIPALGHSLGGWVTTKTPDCEKPGEEQQVCSWCGHSVRREIAATGHDYKTQRVEATCDRQGYTAHTCSRCGDSYKTDYADALGHRYQQNVVEPTCTKEGYTQSVCSRCGDTVKTNYVDALGHSFETKTVEPTCTKDGYLLKTCMVCGDTEKSNYVTAPGHSFETKMVAPTCTKDGYTLKTCTVCGDTEKSGFITASGHSFESEIVPPTCTKDGYTLHTCGVCGETEKSDPTSKTGHHYDGGVVTKEPTTTAMGRITYTCTGCGDTYTETIPKLVNPFQDVKKSDWYFSPVIWAVDRGITSGTDETHFSPNAPCTRAQVVTFLWRAMGSPEPGHGDCSFTDVPEGSYFRKAVLWAAQQGITSGVSPDRFGANEPCTRAQVVTFLYAAKGRPAWEGTDRFIDVNRDDYFWLSVSWASDNAITSGVDGQRFGPAQICTRAQIVTFLYKADDVN